MFSLSLRLPNWIGSTANQSYPFLKYGQLTKHLNWEIEAGYSGWGNLFSLRLNLDTKGSNHARIGFDITLLGLMFSANIHDIRHWDYENNQWEEYNESN